MVSIFYIGGQKLKVDEIIIKYSSYKNRTKIAVTVDILCGLKGKF